MTISGLAGKPLARPLATLSPSDGERDGVRGIWCIPPLLIGNWYHMHNMGTLPAVAEASSLSLQYDRPAPKPSTCDLQATYEPSTWEQRATHKPPTCDHHATYMRPSCDPQAPPSLV
jgi:hypothetical protein